jgi:hypothetical protein
LNAATPVDAQVVSYLGYSGHQTNAVVTAAHNPEPTSPQPQYRAYRDRDSSRSLNFRVNQGSHMGETSFALLTATWDVVFALEVLAIGEAIGMWLFWPQVLFRTGFLVLQETRSIPLPTPAVGSEFETKSGRFKIIAPQLCFFRRRMHWLSVFMPFSIKGSLRWNGSGMEVEGRFPVFSILFFAAWIVFGVILQVVVYKLGDFSFSFAFVLALGVGFGLLWFRWFEAQVSGPT